MRTAARESRGAPLDTARLQCCAGIAATAAASAPPWNARTSRHCAADEPIRPGTVSTPAAYFQRVPDRGPVSDALPVLSAVGRRFCEQARRQSAVRNACAAGHGMLAGPRMVGRAMMWPATAGVRAVIISGGGGFRPCEPAARCSSRAPGACPVLLGRGAGWRGTGSARAGRGPGTRRWAGRPPRWGTRRGGWARRGGLDLPQALACGQRGGVVGHDGGRHRGPLPSRRLRPGAGGLGPGRAPGG